MPNIQKGFATFSSPPISSHDRGSHERGFAPIILIVLLLAGVGLTVYLIGQQTNLFPKAAISDPVRNPQGGDRTSISNPIRAVQGSPAPVAVRVKTTGYVIKTGININVNDAPKDMFEADTVPDVTTFRVGQLVNLKIKVASDYFSANNFTARLVYPVDKLEAIQVSPDYANALNTTITPTPPYFITKWNTQKIKGADGKIVLVGQVAGGIKTDPTKTKPKMANIIFKAKAPGTVDLKMGPGSMIVRASDGQSLSLQNKGLTITIRP